MTPHRKILSALITASQGGHHKINNITVGPYLTMVDSEFSGLASSLGNGNGSNPSVGLMQKSIDEVLPLLHSRDLHLVSIAMAALNALLAGKNRGRRGNAFEFVLDRARNKTVGVIGHFPFVEQLKKTAAETLVFEQNPMEEDLPAEAVPELLPRCELVLITGQTIMNGTFGYIIVNSPGAFRVILGPSTPLSPVLFDYGIDVIGGAVVTDADAVKKQISRGRRFKDVTGVERRIMIK